MISHMIYSVECTFKKMNNSQQVASKKACFVINLGVYQTKEAFARKTITFSGEKVVLPQTVRQKAGKCRNRLGSFFYCCRMICLLKPLLVS